jgi:hypothetical protein
VERARRRVQEQAVEGPAAPTAAPEPALLALQRTSGNAAVTRMLALQQAGAGAPAGPRRIDRHDVLISTVRGPTLHEQGAFEWYVTFALPFEAESDGFIIQELYQESTATREGGDHFWECWRVRAGSRSPADRGDDYDDRYRNLRVPGAPRSASGWNRHVGVARFYAGPLPSEFGVDEPGAHFYMTRSRPSVWTGAGTRHDCYSEWNTASARNGLVAYAGSEELRAGTAVTFRPRA